MSLGFAIANYAGALVLNQLGVTPRGATEEDPGGGGGGG